MEKFTGQILLISGERGSGKTLLCRRVAEVARKANWQVRGLLSPAIMKNDVQVGIGVEDLNSSKRFMLARQPNSSDAEAEIRTENWVFDARCVAWCNTVLEQSTPTDLLVIDEVGPLELTQNTGWTAALPVVDGGKYHLALVVVRKEFVQTLQERWPKANIVTVANVDRIDYLVGTIIDTLMANLGISGGAQ